MLIIGCDFHTRYQQIAMAREETGELLAERRLDHESGEAHAFYRSLQSSPGAAPFGFKGAVFDFPSSMLSASPSALCLFNVVNPNQPFLTLRVVRPAAP